MLAFFAFFVKKLCASLWLISPTKGPLNYLPQMLEFKHKKFKMRLVDENDAAFILELRTDPHLAKYLNPTSPEIKSQLKWIREYKKREQAKTEFYFLFESYTGEKLGLTRIYNFTGDTFEFGSWIFKKNKNSPIPKLADLATKDFAFNELRFKKCVIIVNKKNINVIQYQKLFHPDVSEDEVNYYFSIDYNTYNLNKQKAIKLFKVTM